MLSKSQFLKKLISSTVSKTFLYPSLTSFSHPQNIFLSFSKILHHSFSSFQSINSNYKDDLTLLEGFSRQQLAFAGELLQRYSTSQDLETFNPKEIQWITSLLHQFANASREQGNLHKAYSYIKEAGEIYKKLNIDNNYSVANNHHIKASLSLNLQDLTTDIEYHLNEADRICDLLGDDPDARSLKVQNLLPRGDFHLVRNEHDKALEFFNQALEKKDQVVDVVLPSLLISIYQKIGEIYASRGEVDKALEFWTKGLEAAIPYDGENSTQVFFFYWNSAEALYQNQRFQETLPYIEKGLQVALKIYPSDHPQIAWCNYLLANVLVANGDHAKALEEYKKAIKTFEMSPQEHLSALSDIYFKVAKIHHELENSQEASVFFVKSKEMLTMSNDPNIADICLDRGMQLAKNGNLEEVEFYFKEALDACKKSKPQDKEKTAEVNFLLGDLYFEKKDWNQALKFLKESEKLFKESSADPHSLFLLNSVLATLNALSKDYDQSVKYLQKTIQACQVNGIFGYLQEAYYYLGKVYYLSGMTEKGKEADEKFKNLCKSNNQEDPDVQNAVKHAQKVFSPMETLGEQKREI